MLHLISQQESRAQFHVCDVIGREWSSKSVREPQSWYPYRPKSADYLQATLHSSPDRKCNGSRGTAQACAMS